MRRLKPSGQVLAGTTSTSLDDVHVPTFNLVGTEGQGMKYIIADFNHRASHQKESLRAWVKQFLYQMVHLPSAEADSKLGGLIALAKAKARTSHQRVCTVCGTAFWWERILPPRDKGSWPRGSIEVMRVRIPGASEGIMLDRAVRQLVRSYPAKYQDAP